MTDHRLRNGRFDDPCLVLRFMAFITDIVRSYVPEDLHLLGDDFNLVSHVLFPKITNAASAGSAGSILFLGITKDLKYRKRGNQFFPGSLGFPGMSRYTGFPEFFLGSIF